MNPALLWTVVSSARSDIDSETIIVRTVSGLSLRDDLSRTGTPLRVELRLSLPAAHTFGDDWLKALCVKHSEGLLDRLSEWPPDGGDMMQTGSHSA